MAEALRSQTKRILRDWEKQVRRHVAPANHAGPEILDSVPDILSAIADALASNQPDEVKRLMERSPAQGINRFLLHYDVRELATEDRMLRRLMIDHIETKLCRRTTREEDAALNWAIDLMWQQAMVAFVTHQNNRLRESAEAELKYLSFLSHDLSGNLGNITVWLQILKQKLGTSPQFATEVSALDAAQDAILNTMGGMGKLLQAERLRHRGVEPVSGAVNLRELCTSIIGQIPEQAAQKGVRVEMDVPADATVTSDEELLRLIVQNLVGNAVKYSTRGTVRVRVEQPENGRQARWTLFVCDEGPGIAPERLDSIFDAFRRGEVQGQGGVGLGLTIAARAAKLLGAELTVESKVGVGSTFRLALPPG